MRIEILIAKRFDAFCVFVDYGEHPAALREFLCDKKADAAGAEYRVRDAIVDFKGYALLQACRIKTGNKLPLRLSP
jgi:hypothetical protein